jgi:hypothetical protein
MSAFWLLKGLKSMEDSNGRYAGLLEWLLGV